MADAERTAARFTSPAARQSSAIRACFSWKSRTTTPVIVNMGISNKPQSDKKTVRERPHAIKADVQWGHGAPGAGSAIPHSGQVAGTVSAVIGKKTSHFYHSRI